MYEDPEIVLCDKCKGTGYLVHRKAYTFQNRYWKVKCYACNGTGRTIKIVKFVEMNEKNLRTHMGLPAETKEYGKNKENKGKKKK